MIWHSRETEEIERRLEVIMPEEELPEGNEIVHMVGGVSPIMAEIKDMIICLIDHTAEAYYQVGLVAEWFLALAKICTPEQIIVIMHLAAWPLIQLEGTHGFPEAQREQKKRKDLPNEHTESQLNIVA